MFSFFFFFFSPLSSKGAEISGNRGREGKGKSLAFCNSNNTVAIIHSVYKMTHIPFPPFIQAIIGVFILFSIYNIEVWMVCFVDVGWIWSVVSIGSLLASVFLFLRFVFGSWKGSL